MSLPRFSGEAQTAEEAEAGNVSTIIKWIMRIPSNRIASSRDKKWNVRSAIITVLLALAHTGEALSSQTAGQQLESDRTAKFNLAVDELIAHLEEQLHSKDATTGEE